MSANIFYAPESPVSQWAEMDPIERLLNIDQLASMHGYPRSDEAVRDRRTREWSLRANPNQFRVTRGDR